MNVVTVQNLNIRLTDMKEKLAAIGEITDFESGDVSEVERLNFIKDTMKSIRNLSNIADHYCSDLLNVCEGLPEKQLELFKKKVRETTFESFAMLPDPYPETELERKNFVAPPELEAAVKKVQDIMISVVEENFDSLQYSSLL